MSENIATRPVFIECSTKEIRYLRGEIVENHPVNMSLCKKLVPARFAWYPDNTGKPSLRFAGTDVEWVYESKADRDADLKRILDIFKP